MRHKPTACKRDFLPNAPLPDLAPFSYVMSKQQATYLGSSLTDPLCLPSSAEIQWSCCWALNQCL